MNKKIIFPAFIVMVLVQLYIPVKMIINKESVLSGGKEFRFKTAPIDPTDPFRGKYITLSFEANSTNIPDAEGWNQGEEIFVLLGEDDKGFVKINSVSKEKPIDIEDYVTASIGYVIDDTLDWVSIDYPFTRFYMEESKAGNAEEAYREAARDTSQVTYALVSIKNGEAVVKDVLINDIPIKEVIKSQAEHQEE